jgi:glucose/arabinose dehydrogenase
MLARRVFIALAAISVLIFLSAFAQKKVQNSPVPTHSTHSVITGQDAFADYTQQKPGVRRKITVADLPGPNPSEAVENQPKMAPRPEGAWPQAPAGFMVTLFAKDLNYPRLLRTAPNGDIFLAESRTGEIKVFRGVDAGGKAQQMEVFATGLERPWGGLRSIHLALIRSGSTSATRAQWFAFPTRVET